MMTKIKSLINKVEWVNFWFLIVSFLGAVLGSIWVFSNGGPHFQTWILFGVLMMLTGLGVTAGYHRLFSHKSYEGNFLAKLFLLLFGGAAFEGSAREWCCAHRKHHRFVDTDKDPYNIKRGFWYAHIGWVVISIDQSDESGIQDLKADPLVMFQDKYYVPLAVSVGFILPAFLGSLWGDLWGGLFIAGFLRVVLNLQFTFLINSYCHFFGKQRYSDNNTARDSAFISFFTYGEGYHNFHHVFQHDYRNGVRKFDWDPTKWFIYLMSNLKMATNLKRVSPQRILEAKLLMDQKHFKKRYFNHASLQANIEEWNNRLVKIRENITTAHTKLYQLKAEYKKLKAQKIETMMDRIEEIKQEISRCKNEFEESLNHWKLLMEGRQLVLAGV